MTREVVSGQSPPEQIEWAVCLHPNSNGAGFAHRINEIGPTTNKGQFATIPAAAGQISGFIATVCADLVEPTKPNRVGKGTMTESNQAGDAGDPKAREHHSDARYAIDLYGGPRAAIDLQQKPRQGFCAQLLDAVARALRRASC